MAEWALNTSKYHIRGKKIGTVAINASPTRNAKLENIAKRCLELSCSKTNTQDTIWLEKIMLHKI